MTKEFAAACQSECGPGGPYGALRTSHQREGWPGRAYGAIETTAANILARRLAWGRNSQAEPSECGPLIVPTLPWSRDRGHHGRERPTEIEDLP